MEGNDTVEYLATRAAALRVELEETTRRLKSTTRAVAAIRNDLGPAMKGPTTYGLPVEIITQIFVSLHESQPLVRNPDPRTLGSTAPRDWNPEVTVTLPVKCSTWPRAEVVLSQVCRHWRHVALGLPSLWSVFWTRPETATCEGLITETRRLRTYLRRSKNHHLELYLEFQPPAYLPSDADTRFWTLMKEMLFVTVGYAHRWKCFTLSALNHDKRMLQCVIYPFQTKLETTSAPNLQKFVVRTSPAAFAGIRVVSEYGWTEQVLHPNSQHRASLKYVRLDRAGLSFFRPSIGRVAHLVFEYGVRNDSYTLPTFQMDWPVFIAEILRSPHLESLSICDELLRATTFPGSPWDWAGLHVNMQRIKHLRLGRCQERGERHSALYFLLRYITAPRLESLTIAGYFMEESPWGLVGREEWLREWETISGFKALEVFPSLKSLYLIDLIISKKTVADVAGAFIRLADITTFARRLIVSASLKPVFESFTSFQTLAVSQFWPLAEEVTLNYALGHLFHHWSNSLHLTFTLPWQNIQVLRLPPTQIALWERRIGEGGAGNLRRWGKDIAIVGVEFPAGFLVVKPIHEVVPKYWPPDADITSHNTLEFEGAARPFYQSVVLVDG